MLFMEVIMPQKTKIEKQDIILAALDIVRKDGMAALNAREVAKRLQCSTQPIFSKAPCIAWHIPFPPSG